jgi:RNA polymerase sigma-70 factor (ECF subfamily)
VRDGQSSRDVDEQRWSQLMRAAQGGDRRAYERLLGELGRVIECFLRSRFGELESLEDCVQESLLALHNARHTYDPERPFRPWMFTIVRHRSIDVLRRAPPAHTAVPAGLCSPEVDVGAQLDSARLLRKLAPREREAVQLTKLAGYSMAEAGSRCGVSESAMKVRVHRALKSLKKLLEREESRA